MMVMMPVMVMMMPVSALVDLRVTGLFVAVLAGGFKLKSCMGDAVFGELLAHGFFDVMRVSISDHVERCIVVVSVHTPNVDMMHVLHALDVRKMLA